jgi:homoserine dehydrogenase
MNVRHEIGIALLGMGVVGGGVAETLLKKPAVIAQRAGSSLIIRGALVRDLKKARAVQSPPFPVTTDAQHLLTLPEVQVVVEVMGGEQPAFSYIERALRAGKHVVTANKEVLAKHGPQLWDLAHQKGVQLRFEASVGGGIPIIAPLQRDLLANDISSVRAIINGTTNFILTRMARDGLDFGVALKQAQDLGYAEADPTNDVEGIDAAYKLAVLASLAFHTRVTAADVKHEGITKLRAKDFQYARELGYAIKLLAIASHTDGGVTVRVHPALVPQETLLAKVDGAFNAVEVKGDLTGTVTFHGLGAGPYPTASAVIADIINVARAINGADRLPPPPPPARAEGAPRLRSMEELNTSYYIRLNVHDRPGVLARIATVLGSNQISIASVIQKDADEAQNSAELVITTHPAQEARMQRALLEVAALDVVREINTSIRVEPV